MTDREKLIELIGESLCSHLSLSCKLAENIAADLIANGVTFATDKNVGHWIPVTERLPETDRVLVLDSVGNIFSAGFEDCADDGGKFGEWAAIYDDHTYGYVDSEWCPYCDITHWMPLPEPPKEV